MLQADYSVPTSVIFYRAPQYTILTTGRLQPLALAESYSRTIEMSSWVHDWTIPTKRLPLAELNKIASHFTRDVDNYIFESTGNSEAKARMSSDLITLVANWDYAARILVMASNH
jgi:hypothetical protein